MNVGYFPPSEISTHQILKWNKQKQNENIYHCYLQVLFAHRLRSNTVCPPPPYPQPHPKWFGQEPATRYLDQYKYEHIIIRPRYHISLLFTVQCFSIFPFFQSNPSCPSFPIGFTFLNIMVKLRYQVLILVNLWFSLHLFTTTVWATCQK